MKTIRCIIVDDEPLARDLLFSYIQQLDKWHVVAQCKNALEAYDAFYQHGPDVVFLDIQMPVVSGIDFVGTLSHRPLIVFTTAFPQYAVTAFELSAIDYLLKPITKERFNEAIIKLEKLLSESRPPLQLPIPDYIFVKQERKLVKVVLADILYVEALKDFSRIHLNTSSLLVGMHLKEMENILPSNDFIRIHRSHIINLRAITSIQGNVVELGATSLNIGDVYKGPLLQRLNLQ